MRTLPCDFSLIDPRADDLVDQLYLVWIVFSVYNPATDQTCDYKGMIIDVETTDNNRIELSVMVDGWGMIMVRDSQVMRFLS